MVFEAVGHSRKRFRFSPWAGAASDGRGRGPGQTVSFAPASCGGSGPGDETAARIGPAPGVYRVTLETRKGEVTSAVTMAWAIAAAGRFYRQSKPAGDT